MSLFTPIYSTLKNKYTQLSTNLLHTSDSTVTFPISPHTNKLVLNAQSTEHFSNKLPQNKKKKREANKTRICQLSSSLFLRMSTISDKIRITSSSQSRSSCSECARKTILECYYTSLFVFDVKVNLKRKLLHNSKIGEMQFTLVFRCSIALATARNYLS